MGSVLDIDREVAEKLHRWAQTVGVELHVGEVGFWRPCVGMMAPGGAHYVDYEPPYRVDRDWTQEREPDERLQPTGAPDAYHKHPCMAVLYGDDRVTLNEAARQLLAWCESISAHGKPRVERMPTGATGVQAMFSGTHAPVLVLDNSALAEATGGAGHG